MLGLSLPVTICTTVCATLALPEMAVIVQRVSQASTLSLAATFGEHQQLRDLSGGERRGRGRRGRLARQREQAQHVVRRHRLVHSRAAAVPSSRAA